ncbi:hypothetical protein [Ralstonia solanacearum]|uniref:hypothetical protein n=1 Tax=Ralstonia solanacearum TaxID=305 RepID=UPI0012D36AC9|nr:hypothetical protein [Ralstonia solanacearum]
MANDGFAIGNQPADFASGRFCQRQISPLELTGRICRMSRNKIAVDALMVGRKLRIALAYRVKNSAISMGAQQQKQRDPAADSAGHE